MTVRVLTREQVRAFDRAAIDQFHLNSLVLMENAARGAVDVLQELGVGGPVVICCGPGNNGGDGLAMARHLHLRGAAVKVLLFAEASKISPDSRANLVTLQKTRVSIVVCPDADPEQVLAEAGSVDGVATDWIVEAILGTGSRPPVRPPLDWILPLLNEMAVRRMAVDVPAGLDCDSNQTDGPVFHADATCTFVAAKPVFDTAAGRKFAGAVRIVDIGAPPEVFETLERLGD